MVLTGMPDPLFYCSNIAFYVQGSKSFVWQDADFSRFLTRRNMFSLISAILLDYPVPAGYLTVRGLLQRRSLHRQIRHASVPFFPFLQIRAPHF